MHACRMSRLCWQTKCVCLKTGVRVCVFRHSCWTRDRRHGAHFDCIVGGRAARRGLPSRREVDTLPSEDTQDVCLCCGTIHVVLCTPAVLGQPDLGAGVQLVHPAMHAPQQLHFRVDPRLRDIAGIHSSRVERFRRRCMSTLVSLLNSPPMKARSRCQWLHSGPCGREPYSRKCIQSLMAVQVFRKG